MRKRNQTKIGGRNEFKSGDWVVLDDYSGFKVHASKCKRTWDGFVVQTKFWESRQPQDYVRGVKDKIATPPKFTRPEGEDVFLTSNEVTADDL
jgi:hypothetical protein